MTPIARLCFTKSAEAVAFVLLPAEPGGICEHTYTGDPRDRRRFGTRSMVVDDPTTVTRYPAAAAGARARHAHLRQHAYGVRQRRGYLAKSIRCRTMKL